MSLSVALDIMAMVSKVQVIGLGLELRLKHAVDVHGEQVFSHNDPSSGPQWIRCCWTLSVWSATGITSIIYPNAFALADIRAVFAGGYVLVIEFWGMPLNCLFCTDVLQPLDLAPLTDFTYKYHPVTIIYCSATLVVVVRSSALASASDVWSLTSALEAFAVLEALKCITHLLIVNHQ